LLRCDEFSAGRADCRPGRRPVSRSQRSGRPTPWRPSTIWSPIAGWLTSRRGDGRGSAQS